MRIQHNILAMNSYRNYTNNTSALGKNLERLSSGYKINRAGDDAAGLAISEKMRAQITGLDAAQKNVKDGVSLVKTAEGALQEVQDMLNRMVYLANQSANGTYDNDTDRQQLQKEMDQLKAEINRIADSSNFNGINLLDGSMDTTTLATNEVDLSMGDPQTNAYFEIISDGQLADTPRAGVFQIDFSDFSGAVMTDAGDFMVTLFGELDDDTGSLTQDSGVMLNLKDYFGKGAAVTGEQLAKAIASVWNDEVRSGTNTELQALFAQYGEGFSIKAEQSGTSVIFTMNKAPSSQWATDCGFEMTNLKPNEPSGGTESTNQGGSIQLKVLVEPIDSASSRQYARSKIDIDAMIQADLIKDGTTLKLGDTTYTFAVGRDSTYKNLNNIIDLTDLTAATIKTSVGTVTSRITTAALNNRTFHVTTQGNLANSDGYIYLTEREGGVDTNNYKLEGTTNAVGLTNTDGDWTGLLMLGQIDNDNMGKALTLQIGDTSDSYNQLRVSIEDCHVASLGLSDVIISDQDSAAVAVSAIKNAINHVSSIRGTLGATQNRLEHTQNNLSVMAENIQDAESTIRDTDVAEEMMSYVKNNILVQSAQAMLAQANQVPQGVLQLLG